MAESLAGQLRITIITPAPRGSQSGNRVTALRWAGLLRQLGHRVRVANTWTKHTADVLVAVHAIKSAQAVLDADRDCPDLRIVTLLAGTDIYPTFAPSDVALAALARADALIALQPRALDLLPEELRKKTKTIVQSATAVTAPRHDQFTAIVLAHLRPVKQPLLAITAIDKVAADVPMKLLLAGEQLDDDYGEQVANAAASSSRSHWIGPLSRKTSKQALAQSHVCLVPSSSEGGANVVSEAIAAGTPILCSAIPGNTGLVGDDWPGLFPPGDTDAFAQLLTRAATDKSFFDELCQRTAALQPMVSPQSERLAWRDLLAHWR